MFHGVIAHGMWDGALISTFWSELPGPGTVLNQEPGFLPRLQ
jgi:phosphate acetyltransferase/phosphate butyryltransferase